MMNKQNVNSYFDNYKNLVDSRVLELKDNVVYYPSGLKFTIPMNSSNMGAYHSTTEQDIIPLSIRANHIEDIFNLFCQELITGGARLLGTKGKKNSESTQEEKVLPETYYELFNEVSEFHRLKGDEEIKDVLSLWFSENYNVITDKSLEGALNEIFSEKKRYEELDRYERIHLFKNQNIDILEPSHLLLVKAYPSKNGQRYGKFLFSLLTTMYEENLDVSLLEKIRDYFIEEEHLGFETRLILDYLKSKIGMDIEQFDNFKKSYVPPFCPAHAKLLREDLNSLFEMEKSYKEVILFVFYIRCYHYILLPM